MQKKREQSLAGEIMISIFIIHFSIFQFYKMNIIRNIYIIEL